MAPRRTARVASKRDFSDYASTDDRIRASPLSVDARKLRGTRIWFMNSDYLRRLGIIHEVNSTDRPFVVRSLDDPGPIKVILKPTSYSTDPAAGCFSWCRERQRAGGGTAGWQSHDGNPSS